MRVARTVFQVGSLVLNTSPFIQAFQPKVTIPRKLSTTTVLAAMSDEAGCKDGVCVPLGVQRQNQTLLTTSNEKVTSGKNKIKIDIISDTMCPWCFVGKRNMEAALKDMPEMNAEVDWHPFFLDRRLPEDGKPVEEYYVGNYGDPKAGERMKPALVNAGKKAGIDFETHFINMTHYRPTIRSHRLIALAKEQDKEDEMVEELFEMYYHEAKHLNSIEHLASSAAKVGLEGDIKAYLESDENEKEVFDEADYYLRSARGVPTFIFTKPGSDLHYSFSGGQPPSAFKQVFNMFSQN